MQIQILDKNSIVIAIVNVKHGDGSIVIHPGNNHLPDVFIYDRQIQGVVSPPLEISLEDWAKNELEEALFIAQNNQTWQGV